MYGSYAKDCAHKNSDIDVAVVVPKIKDWFSESAMLCHAIWNVDTSIEPILIEENEASPLYSDIMHTGITV